MGLLSNSYFALFLIISLGFILGKIKIRGISLDVSAVLFIALLFGHYGVLVPTDFQYIGLTLFIFTIAIQSGPGFIQSFRKQGIPLFILTLILVFSALLISILCSYFLNIDRVIGIGLFAGAITSTPGLAVAIDVTGSSMASIGYGIAYPFGILGVIIFVRLFPKIMKISLSKAEKDIRDQTNAEYPEIYSKQYIVENHNIIGKPLEELQIRTMTGASITRVLQDERAITPMPDLILNKGNLIKAVGTNKNLEKIRLLVGSETDREIPLAKDFVVQSVLVTNKKVVNKTVEQLNLFSAYGATIASIRRSGINIASTPKTHILFGDKLMIACSKDNMKEVVRLLGNEVKRLSDTDFFPIAAGIVLGILVGHIR
ncbi:MAG: transporter, partial [Bacteroidales bacterium]|nr:transporter [Bacteroidales bacterium]